MEDLSLKFKTEARSAEVLNVNERPTMRSNISFLGLYFEIVNFSDAYRVWNFKFKTWMGNYSAPLSPIDIQKPPLNFQGEVLNENLKPNGNKRTWAW